MVEVGVEMGKVSSPEVMRENVAGLIGDAGYGCCGANFLKVFEALVEPSSVSAFDFKDGAVDDWVLAQALAGKGRNGNSSLGFVLNAGYLDLKGISRSYNLSLGVVDLQGGGLRAPVLSKGFPFLEGSRYGAVVGYKHSVELIRDERLCGLTDKIVEFIRKGCC